MKKISFLILGTFFLLSGCKNQQDSASKNGTDADMQVLYATAVKSLNDRNFLFEADRLSYQNHKPEIINPGANYISLQGDEATVQIFPRSEIAGTTAIRNINVKGTASNVEVKANDKGDITFKMYVKGVDIEATIMINVEKKVNRYTATITPNFDGKKITLFGKIYALETPEE